MFVIHEGEILLKENYGSTNIERFYVKPTEQPNVVVVDDEKSNLKSIFTKIFLPQGFPESVSKDYVTYQVWDTAQAFCSTITGILATQEVLKGVGVGNTTASPLAATFTWVIKDVCGHLGKILFAFTHGTYLDAYSKKWRLYADTLNDAAMCIEIALPLFKNYTTFALCVSTAMKAVVGVAGGATRAAMTQHHAVRGNMADVSAKDSAQETAVNFIASFAALLIITVFGNSLFIFLLMMIMHIICNYFAVRAVCLRTLNEPRFLQIIDQYLRKEVIASPCEINSTEPVIFYQLGPNLLDLKLCGFQMKLGHSVKKMVDLNAQAVHLKNIKEVYDERNYILVPNIRNRKMYILIKKEAKVDDILCSYFHAVLLSIIICAINDDPLPIYKATSNPRPFTQICETLQSAEWSRETADVVGFSGFAYEPSYDLMRYVDNIVQNEWNRIRAGIIHTGWDISKHLLVTDEWRVSCGNVVAKPISVDMTNNEAAILPSMKLKPFRETSTSRITLPTMRSNDKITTNTFTIEPEMKIPSLFELSKSKVLTASLESKDSEAKKED